MNFTSSSCIRQRAELPGQQQAYLAPPDIGGSSRYLNLIATSRPSMIHGSKYFDS
jgi:hypothetical protein